MSGVNKLARRSFVTLVLSLFLFRTMRLKTKLRHIKQFHQPAVELFSKPFIHLLCSKKFGREQLRGYSHFFLLLSQDKVKLIRFSP
jgi:hypothetical protein